MLQIRPYLPADAAAVAAVILPIQQAEFGIPITLEGQPDLADIQNFYQHGNGNFWVAEADGQVVGTIALLDVGNRQVALRKMFVAQAFRGREHGTAGHLLDAAMQWAQAHKVSSIFLGTTAKFLAAHRFYEKNGFVEVAREDLPPAFPVMVVDTKFYQRDLGV